MEHRLRDKELIEPGSIETCLNPDFDLLPPEQIYKEYEMDVPEDVIDFCKVIESEGGRALLVGGCVRDLIISKENGEEKLIPKDIDIEVYGIAPKHLASLVVMMFGENKDKTHGKKFEMLSVNSRDKKLKFDISIPREDNKTGTGNKGFDIHSHPEFSIAEGARRRDTTCNSMAYDPLTKITYDPYKGRQDIWNGVLRATDEEKFIEDPVRILRLMRFAARYDWKVAPETEALCIWMMNKDEMKKRQEQRAKEAVLDARFDIAYEILDKSPIELDDETNERLYAEFAKMFVEGGKPSVGLEFIRRVGVVDRFFPWLAELTITEQEYEWHREGDAWKHTLQVLDTAAQIMRREKMEEEEGLVFMLAALGHDLGKPTKTEKKLKKNASGEWKEVITSDGHDMEGGWLSEEFINAFAPKDKIKIVRDQNGEYAGLKETNFAKEIRQKVRILTEKHMQLKAWYLDYTKIKEKNPEKAEKQARKWLGGLARKLAENGTSIFMLSFLTEADQRGRNGERDVPLEREQVKDLDNWQNWLNEMMDKVEIKKELPKMIVEGELVKKETGLSEGMELGVVMSWLFDDQLAGEFTAVEDGLARANIYTEMIRNILQIAKNENWKTRAMPKKKIPPRIEDDVYKWLKEDGVREKVLSNPQLSIFEKIIEKEESRVADLGGWPENIKLGSLTKRIPSSSTEAAPGFDAGVACALRLIPEDKQELAAKLHANYSEESVGQIQKEVKENDPDSPTTWWLAASSICKEGEITANEFLKQVEDFKELANDPEKRLAAAKSVLEKMTSSFEIVNGVPFGTEDGCMQGAYLAGYKYAVMYAKQYDLYFVGTYLPTLGLDGFEWSTTETGEVNDKSGPVFGSKQFVKCKDEEELGRVLRLFNII